MQWGRGGGAVHVHLAEEWNDTAVHVHVAEEWNGTVVHVHVAEEWICPFTYT